MTAPQKFRKRPVVVEAMQWDGSNLMLLWEWVGAGNLYGPLTPHKDDHTGETCVLCDVPQPARLFLAANNAWLDLEVGEWIIRDSKGFYPCKPDTFTETYTEVSS